jgi:3-hydroxybutyryl-CoA dehydratase
MNEYSWNDLQIGMKQEFEVSVTQDAMDAFGKISGDSNPLHADPAYAARFGFERAVVFGLLTSSFYSCLVGVYLPGKHALLQGIDIDFVAPVYVGDTLLVVGEIIFLSEAYHRAEIKARICKQGGVVVSKATIRVGVHAA